jgi:hypothetical protein
VNDESMFCPTCPACGGTTCGVTGVQYGVGALPKRDASLDVPSVFVCNNCGARFGRNDRGLTAAGLRFVWHTARVLGINAEVTGPWWDPTALVKPANTGSVDLSRDDLGMDFVTLDSAAKERRIVEVLAGRLKRTSV